MRRLKESLMATALKLQVSTQVVQCDATTIQYLRKDLEEAKKSLNVSTQKETAANDLIQSLRLEIIQLKRRLKEDQDANQHSHIATGSIAMIHQEADNQVKKMMSKRGVLLNIEEGNELALINQNKEKTTHFQDWKMKKFIWAPDTPGGSVNRDDQVVEELLCAAMASFEAGGVMKTNKITVAKRRPGTTSKLNSTHGRNVILPGLNTNQENSNNYLSQTVSPSPIRQPTQGNSFRR